MGNGCRAADLLPLDIAMPSSQFRLLSPWITLSLACVAVALGCQPTRLDTAQVTGTVAGGDTVASDVAVVGDAVTQPDVAVAGTDATGGDGPKVGDANAECTTDGDCAAKAAPCDQFACDGGKCKFQPKPDTAACNDGNPCTSAEMCTAGKCGGGQATNCDDKNTCTVDSCNSAKGCVNTPLTTGTCNDGNPCTSPDSCKDGVCTGVKICKCETDAECPTTNVCDGPRMCDTSSVPYKCISKNQPKKCEDALPNDCTQTFCDPATGECATKQAPDLTPCQDGFGPCTAGDECKSGQCKQGTQLCECISDANCAQFNKPDDKCAAKFYCDKYNSLDAWTCKPIPASIIKCDKAGDNPCTKNTCNTKTGKCELTNLNAPGSNIACDDGLPGTKGDYCDDDGICKFSAVTTLCKSTADCAKYENGDVCDGTLYCDKSKGECLLNPATVVKCATALDTVCSKTLCNKKTGKCEVTPTERLGKSCPIDDKNCDTYVFLADGATITVPCEDGDVCTGSSSCKGGSCTAEPTSFVCGCKEDVDCASKEDGNLCNGTLFCNKAKGKCEINPATVVNCTTVGDNQCAKNVCDPTNGKCKLTEIGAPGNYVPCEDGNLCTHFDDCEGGACVSGINLCKCTKDEECTDDGDFCNGTLFCNKANGSCDVNPLTVVKCTNSFDTACLKNSCDKATGKCNYVAVSDQLSCEDNNPCTSGDVCVKGDCVSGLNKCECTANAECSGKEDGNVCNGTLYCDKAKQPFICKVNPSTVVYCAVGLDTDCVKNTCDKLTGKCDMKPVPELFAPCTDNNPCTVNDECVSGACKSGTNLCNCVNDADCAAKEQSSNKCVGKLGCLTIDGKKLCTTIPNSAVTCPADKECTKNLCDAGDGICKAVSDESFCDDGNPCTAESCALGACIHTKLTDGSVCGNNKLCASGVCLIKP